MEQNFQTSFIPKKPMVEARAPSSRSIGLFMVIAIFIFLTMLLAWGGLYFYKQYLAKNIDQKGASLELAKKDFDVIQIEKMQTLDKRLKVANEILGKHVAVSPIFQALGEVTLKTIRFTNFSYDLGADKGTKVAIKLKGVALGYFDVASQSEVFVSRKDFIDPAFSNLVRDDKGNVTFDLDFYVDRSFLDYSEMLKREKGSTSTNKNIINDIPSKDINKLN